MNEINDLSFAASRIGYGLRAEESSRFKGQSLSGWLEEQLSPPSVDEPSVTQHLKSARMAVKYPASEGKWPAMDEQRSLDCLWTPIEELTARLLDPTKPLPGNERALLRTAVQFATVIRAIYSRYSVRERMVQFWHDHFHVNAYADDHIAIALPAYDRDVIRHHCLGNFRTMLEAVATSTAMQWYLSNRTSRAGAANENYARELLELHTLGRENYLNDLYDQWREVPGAMKGHPIGYIDQDVYETARAFTGWTIEDGRGIDAGRKLPMTGRFTYVDSWHDGYQKRILATEFEPFGKPMNDGLKVLDLLAEHPATAAHIAKKLCAHLLGANPPDALVNRIAIVFTKYRHADNQITRIIQHIISSPEFLASRGNKVKRPLALLAEYVRIMGYDFTPTEGLVNQLAAAGQKLFGAPTPEGLADTNETFLGVSAMRHRWNLILGLSANRWKTGVPNPGKTLTDWGITPQSPKEVMTALFNLFGAHSDKGAIDSAMLVAGFVPLSANIKADHRQLISAVSLAALSPEFQIS